MKVRDWFLSRWMASQVHGSRTAGVTKGDVLDGARRQPLDMYALIVVAKGELQIAHADEELVLKPSDIVLLDAGKATRFYSHARQRSRTRYAQYLINLGGESGKNPMYELQLPVVVPHRDEERVQAAYDWLAAHTTERFGYVSNAARMHSEAWVHELLAEYISNGFDLGLLKRKRQDIPQWLQDTRAYIRKNIRMPLTSPSLATITGYSEAYLIREFKKAYGETPMQHLRQWRLQIAASILRAQPDITIASLCTRVGFTNRKTFEAAFKQRYGLSPKHWVVAE